MVSSTVRLPFCIRNYFIRTSNANYLDRVLGIQYTTPTELLLRNKNNSRNITQLSQLNYRTTYIFKMNPFIALPPAAVMQDKRIPFWDVLKCVLIFFVIMGHFIQNVVYCNTDDFWHNTVFIGIYAFHMPLFSFVSGYFAARSIAKYRHRTLIRYAARIGIPNLIYFLVCLIKYGHGETLWFLTFVLEAVFFLYLLSLSSKIWVKVGLFSTPFLLIALLYLLNEIHLFCFYSHFLYLYPFFLLGACIRDKGESVIKKYWLFALPLFLVIVPFFPGEWLVYKSPVRMAPYALFVDLVRSLVAVLGGSACMACCLYAAKSVPSIMLKIGKASLALYFLQRFLLEGIPDVWRQLPYSDVIWLSPLYAAVISLLLFMFYRLTRCVPYIGPLLYGEILPTSRK